MRGGYGWVRAEFEYDDAQEEAVGGGGEELICEEHDGREELGGQGGGASCDGAAREFEADWLQDEGAAEAS